MHESTGPVLGALCRCEFTCTVLFTYVNWFRKFPNGVECTRSVYILVGTRNHESILAVSRIIGLVDIKRSASVYRVVLSWRETCDNVCFVNL